MERTAPEPMAFAETVVFLDYFKDLPDPRQAGKVIYPLPEVLLLCLLAVLAGAETFVDIARFGEKKIALLRRFRPFRHGTPAGDGCDGETDRGTSPILGGRTGRRHGDLDAADADANQRQTSVTQPLSRQPLRLSASSIDELPLRVLGGSRFGSFVDGPP